MQEELAAARTAVSAAEDARIAAEVSERRMAATVIHPFSRQSHHMPCCIKISGQKVALALLTLSDHAPAQIALIKPLLCPAAHSAEPARAAAAAVCSP